MTAAGPPAPHATSHGQGSGAVARDLDRTVARLLTIGTYLSVGLLAIGVLLMALAGISPVDASMQPLDLGRIPAELIAGRPEGFLWLGLLAAIATPLGRVASSLVGYIRGGERRMAVIAVAILVVVATAVVVGVIAGR
jgi:uncharacterized membrane protein